jgi:phage-related tail fiber protein
MATIDIRGASVSAADPPISTNPNPDLAIKAPVRVATTGANINLSTIGLGTIDGVALAAGDRVLVKDQTDATTNGIYNAASSVWTRAIDGNNNSQWSMGTTVLVTSGSVNANTIFALTTASPITLGTSNLTFSLFGIIGGGTSTVRVVTTAGSLTVAANDQVIEIEAAVTAISLPASKNGPVTIIDATGNFGGANCTVTVSGGATIAGQANDVLTTNYMTRTYRQLASGNYVIQ